jgi:hypothetical protein
MVFVKKSRKTAFDPKIFFAKVGDGKTIEISEGSDCFFAG